MPNIGFAAAARDLSGHRDMYPVVVSIAGFSIADYVNGVEQFAGVEGIAAIELNFGCPNTQRDHGTIMSFEPHSLNQVFWQIAGKSRRLPIWAKFSPYSDPGLLQEVAQIVNMAGIDAVVTCNTFPSAYAGKDAVSPMGGLAGLSGPALKPIALGQVVQFREHLVSTVDVIGIGGVTVGNDIVDFLDAGANGVEMTSLPFWLGNPSRFWETLLDRKTGNLLEARLD